MWVALAADALADEPVAVVAPALDPAAAALIAELLAMPDHPTRQALLAAKLGSGPDPASAARIGAALGVIVRLGQAGNTDAAALRAELEAALAALAAPAPAAAAPPAGTARLCFGRPSKMGFAIKFSLFIDDKPAGQVNAGKYVVALVPAGAVDLRMQAENTWQATYTVAADEVRYLKVVPTIGAVTSRVRVDEVAVSDAQFAERCPTAEVVFGSP